MTKMVPSHYPFPARFDELTEGERLIVGNFRRWIAGHADGNPNHWLVVWNDFAGQLGAADGKAALGGLEALVRVIWAHARRSVRYHRPCCAMLGPDEWRVVSLVATCQSGEWPAARLLAEWLVGDEGIGDLLGAGSRLAQALRKCGHDLPLRRAEARRHDACGRHGATMSAALT